MKPAESICSMLSGSDRRSIGRATEVADLVRTQPRKIARLIECLWNSEPCIRMRAADAVEKVSRSHPALLQRYKAALLDLLADTSQQQMRWHLAAIVPRLQLTRLECSRAAAVLEIYLQDRSSIVKTFALQGLSDLTRQDLALHGRVLELLHSAARIGTPAMRARSRILLKQVEKANASQART